MVDESRREVVGVLSLKRGGGKKLVVVFPSEEGGKKLVVPVLAHVPDTTVFTLELDREDIYYLDERAEASLAFYADYYYGSSPPLYFSLLVVGANHLTPDCSFEGHIHTFTRIESASLLIWSEYQPQVGFLTVDAGTWHFSCSNGVPSSLIVTIRDTIHNLCWYCPVSFTPYTIDPFIYFDPHLRIHYISEWFPAGTYEVNPGIVFAFCSGTTAWLVFQFTGTCICGVDGGTDIDGMYWHMYNAKFYAGCSISTGQERRFGVLDYSSNELLFGVGKQGIRWFWVYIWGGCSHEYLRVVTCEPTVVGCSRTESFSTYEGMPPTYDVLLEINRSLAGGAAFAACADYPSLSGTPKLAFWDVTSYRTVFVFISKGSSTSSLTPPIGFAVVEDLGEPVDGYTVWLL